MSVHPFTISVPDETLTDLETRLSAARLTDVDVDDWSSGVSPRFLAELVTHWRERYDWRAEERALNGFHHVSTEIDGISMHAVHERAATRERDEPSGIPIVLLHGWPDTFHRFHRVIPLLAAQRDVIVPSLPGFGFSGHTARASAGAADLVLELVTRLGVDRFAVAGGDISTPIVHELALRHPDRVAMVHVTDAGFPNGSEDRATMTPAEQQFAGECLRWWYLEGAYNMEQSTKPRTVAAALADSPVGLAAWIVEKFHAWSGHPDRLTDRFSLDELITNVMLYWVTDTIGSSVRTYAENTRATYATGGPRPLEQASVPTAFAAFPDENATPPREWVERTFAVKRYSTPSRGGHFAALEEPELYAADLAEALAELT